MSKVLICAGTGIGSEWMELSRPGLEAYAAAHGYELRLVSERLAPERPASWDKIPLLAEELQRHEIAVWIDADVSVLRTDADIADHLGPSDYLAMRINETDRGIVPNAGILAMRAGARAQEFLARVWAHTEHIHNPWWENAAMLDEFGIDHHIADDGKVRGCRMIEPTDFYRRGLVNLPVAFNSMFFSSEAEPVFRHHAGVYPRESRASLMRQDAALLSRRRAGERLASHDYIKAMTLAQACSQPLEAEAIRLRAAGAADLPFLRRLFSDPEVIPYWHGRSLDDAEIEAKYTGQRPGYHPFVIEVDGSSAGFCQAFMHERHPGRAGVALALAGCHQNRGLGTSVATLLSGTIREHGLQLAVTPLPGNERAHSCWLKAGLEAMIERMTPHGREIVFA